MQIRVLKSKGSSNEGLICDFCAIDLSSCGASQAMCVWISTQDILLPSLLLKTGWTAKEQYYLRMGSQLTRNSRCPAFEEAPTSLFDLHSCSLRYSIIEWNKLDPNSRIFTFICL